MAEAKYRRVDPKGYVTVFDIDHSRVGTLWTKFPWSDFNEEWQAGLVEFARQVYLTEGARDRVVEQVAFDHIRTAQGTFEPRIDFGGIPQ